jgi:hypothetical protein
LTWRTLVRLLGHICALTQPESATSGKCTTRCPAAAACSINARRWQPFCRTSARTLLWAVPTAAEDAIPASSLLRSQLLPAPASPSRSSRI